MIISQGNLDALFLAYGAEFKTGFNAVDPNAFKIAMKTKSVTSASIYPWLGQFPSLREWIGDRISNAMSTYGFTIENLKFESTLTVPRTTIEDDQYGVFSPMFQQMGRAAAEHPERLIFDLLLNGFTNTCYDGQPFFNLNHPISVGNDGEVVLASNCQPGSGAPWFLFDASQPFKPLIWQERLPYEFQSLNDPKSEHVILRDEYLFGIRARSNAGYGLWQLAFGSKADLTVENYDAARQAMQQLRGDQKQLLGIKPTTMIVGPSMESAARSLLKAETIAATSNIWLGSVDLIVTPFLP